MKNVKIIIATHKKYWMPDDNIYLPIQVGIERDNSSDLETIDLGYEKDNSGDNISYKNKNYCELTALYWAWKNLNLDYMGLAHYRRHFSIKKGKEKKNLILTHQELDDLLNYYDIILPKKRNYYIETNYSQYVHAHHKEDLDTTRAIISEKYPYYLGFYDAYMKQTLGHRFNMFIMKKQYLDQYCAWLFDILFELEQRLDISNYNDYDARVFGFVSERLLDVWINANHLEYKEIPVVFMENEKWISKGLNFVKRKIIGRR